MTRARNVLLLALVCLLGASVSTGDAGQADARQVDVRETGARETDAWTDLDDRTWTAEDLDDRIVVLSFWATWCTPCRAELPHLRRLHERLAGDDVVLLGVALDALDRRRLRAFLLRHAVDWPQIHAPRGVDSPIARRFGVDAVPASRVLDRQGRVVARDLHGRALEVVVASLAGLGEPTARHRPGRSRETSPADIPP